MCVWSILCTGGGCLPQYMLGYTHPPGQTLPLGRHPPVRHPPVRQLHGQTPPGKHPLVRYLPWADTSPGQIPPGNTPPPKPQADVQTATAADGTHLTRMHSCYFCKCLTHWKWAYNHPRFYAYNFASAVADLRGAPGTRLPGGQNSFIFMQFSAKKIGSHIHLGSWRPPPGKILDPPLFCHFIIECNSAKRRLCEQLSKSTMIHFTSGFFPYNLLLNNNKYFLSLIWQKKNFSVTLCGLEPAAACVQNENDTTAP